jgi:EpsI family protein
MHFALAFMLQAAVVSVVGLRMAREIAFPLAFVLFAVPFGEFLVPVLMEHTANFTVAALQATGIPVFREGNHFIIPTGRWSVVEACSGIRYLSASLMAGTLYAYLFYRSYYRRAAFIALSIAVPIVGNWLRAYLTVMIGHLFGSDVVAGFIHIVYGWVFFGVVMAILFAIGSLWREDEVVAASPSDPAVAPRSFDRAGSGFLQFAIAASLAVAVALPWASGGRSLAGTAEVARVRLQAPAGTAGWATSDAQWTQWRPAFVAPGAEIRQTYRAGATQVSLYVAYYVDQAQGRELITAANTFSDHGSWEWKTVAEGRATMPWSGGEQQANVVAVSGPRQDLQVAYLYWIDGKLTTSPYLAKALTAWARIIGQDDRAAVVAIYTVDPSQRGKKGLATLQEFATAMSPEIDRVLRAAVRE